MVHKYDNYEPQTTEKKSLRREVMPEPQYFDDDPYNSIPLDTPVYHVLHCQEECPPPMRRSCSEPQNSSFLSTIKNCVINLTAPYKCKSAPQKTRRRDGSISLHDVICSLKKDVQMIARQQDCNAVNSADPFFTLSAMMCKLNKLEECIIKLMRDEKNTQRRKDMLIVAKAIRKALVKEYLCDEKSLKEKKKKICRILESLKIFEGQIICSGRRSKFQCCMDCASPKLCCKPMDCPCPPKCPEPVCPPKCPPPKCCPPKCPPKCPPPKCCPPKCPKPPVCPPDPCAGPCGDPCADPCPDPCDPCADPCPDPCNPCPDPCDPCADPCPDPCADPCDDPCCDDKTEMEVTSMNFKYLKTNYGQTEAEDELQCSTETSMSLIKNGKKCDVCSNPELRQKVEKSSHLWLASAKELIKSFDCQ